MFNDNNNEMPTILYQSILYQIAALTWLKYCRYCVKLYPINQSISIKQCVGPKLNQHYLMVTNTFNSLEKLKTLLIAY